MSSDAHTPDLQSVNNAKNEYLVSLHKIFVPFVNKFLKEEYTAAVERVGQRKSLKEFQIALTKVPEWNHAMVMERTQTIEQKHPVLSNLVAAVFVSFVKILSSIRISTAKPSIKLKIPSNDKFVHRVFVLSAKKFYEDPWLIKQGTEEEKRDAIFEAVENAVRDMIPMDDVLSAYLSTTVENNAVDPVLSPPPSDDEEEEEPQEEEDEDSEPEAKVIEYTTGRAAPAPYVPTPQPNPQAHMQDIQTPAPTFFDATQSSYDPSHTVDQNAPPQHQGQLATAPIPPPPPPPTPVAQQQQQPLFPDARDGDDLFK